MRHVNAGFDALMRTDETRQAIFFQKLFRHVFAPQHAGASRAFFNSAEVRVRVRIGPQQIPDPPFIPQVLFLGTHVRSSCDSSNVTQRHARVLGKPRVKH